MELAIDTANAATMAISTQLVNLKVQKVEI